MLTQELLVRRSECAGAEDAFPYMMRSLSTCGVSMLYVSTPMRGTDGLSVTWLASEYSTVTYLSVSHQCKVCVDQEVKAGLIDRQKAEHIRTGL